MSLVSFSPLFMSQCQSNQKICFQRTSQSPAALASARGRLLSPPDARGALRSPRCENQGGLAAITALIPSPMCLLLTPSTDFSSLFVVSPSQTHSHILRSSAPALPVALWGEAIARNSSPSGKQPLPRPLPGARRFRVSRVEERLGGSGLRRPPPASRPGSSVQVPVFPLLARRSQLVPSRRLCAESN